MLAGEPWSWRVTSPALLVHAVRQYGFGFLPNQVLPPLLANTAVGVVLYTGYLQTLGLMHEPSSYSTKRVFPPPPPSTTFAAGFIAGSLQSVLAAPLDALQVRFQAKEMMEGKYKTMWQYGWLKTKEIGARGVFAGWTLSFLRDSIGAGVFFSTFETIKSQCFYGFVSIWYGDWANLSLSQRERISAQRTQTGAPPEIRPHFFLEPTFLGIAGVAATLGQALIQHPISRLQEIHYGRLEWIDAHDYHKPGEFKTKALKLYTAAYRKSWKQCLAIARREGGLRRWLYKDFFMTTLRQSPSTAAGLIAFEYLRRMYGNDDEAVRISKDGYEIVLI